MSRMDYDENWSDYAALDYGRFDRNARMVWGSKRGQKMLRLVQAALLALPEPRLIDDHFATVTQFHEGDATAAMVDVCVLGAVALYRGATVAEMADLAEDIRTEWETAAWATGFGMAETMA